MGFVDLFATNWLRRRLRNAKLRVEKERVTIERARERLRYWSRIVAALESRIEAKDQGQIEMDLSESSRPPDL